MGSSDSTENMRVMIVDDENAITDLMAELLRDAGYDVKCEQDGREAVKAISSFRPHIIVSDMHMPNIDGDRLYKRVTEEDSFFLKRFIFMTGSEPDSKTRKFLDDTGCAILTKPFEILDLVSMIKARLDNKGGAAQPESGG